MFNHDLVGILMRLEEDRYTRFQVEIWFDYTRKSMNEIKEGTMLAVPNFASSSATNTTNYSILEVTSVLPIHYGLGNDLSGFPGFVVEAAQNAFQDWETQETEATDDTTKIRCLAIPTNLEIKQVDNESEVGAETNLPMIGADTYVLDTETTNMISNLGINTEVEDTISAGELVRDKNVRILLRVEDLIKVHFGIFGFTGSGKSNLLSTMISKLLTDTDQSVKIVLFDLMGEYTALLIDLICNLESTHLIGLGENTFPGAIVDYLAEPSTDSIDKATSDMLNSTLLPKQLKARQAEFNLPFKKLLEEQKVKIWRDKIPTLDESVKDAYGLVFKGNMGGSKANVTKLFERLSKANVPFSEENVAHAIKLINELIEQNLTNTATSNLNSLKEHINNEWSRIKHVVNASLR